MRTLIETIVADLTAANLAVCTSATWGTAPLYVEQGKGKPARIYRTPGKAGDLAAALAALLAAGRTATLRADRISVSA